MKKTTTKPGSADEASDLATTCRRAARIARSEGAFDDANEFGIAAREWSQIAARREIREHAARGRVAPLARKTGGGR